MDTDDVKEKTSLFFVQGKSACFIFFVVLLFYVICVWYRLPKLLHSHPVDLFIT